MGNFFDAKKFDFAIVGKEARGDDFGVVENEEVVGGEVVGEVAKEFVFDAAAVAMNDEHAGSGAVFERVGGDELGGELVVKVGGA